MPQLNTLSAASLGSSGQSEVIITGGGSIYPVLRAKQLGAGLPNANLYGGATGGIQGFTGQDGYAVLLPVGDATSITYNNATGGLVWTKTLADVQAVTGGTLTDWTGWTMNAARTLITGVAREAVNVFHRFTINAAGTIVDVGSDSTAPNFSLVPQWNTSLSSIQINESTGDLTILGGNDEIAVMNSSAVFTTDPVNPNPASIIDQRLTYKTTSGDYVSIFDATAGENIIDVRIVNADGGVLRTRVPKETGAPSSDSSLRLIEWGGYLVGFAPSSSIISGVRYMETSTLATWVTNLKRAEGFS